jgi:hypothetical protein
MGEIDKSKNSLQPSAEKRADGTVRATSRWRRNEAKQSADGSSRDALADGLKCLGDETLDETLDRYDAEFGADDNSDDWDDNEDVLDEKPTVEDVVSFLDAEGQLGKPKNSRWPTFDPNTQERRRLNWDEL